MMLLHTWNAIGNTTAVKEVLKSNGVATSALKPASVCPEEVKIPLMFQESSTNDHVSFYGAKQRCNHLAVRDVAVGMFRKALKSQPMPIVLTPLIAQYIDDEVYTEAHWLSSSVPILHLLKATYLCIGCGTRITIHSLLSVLCNTLTRRYM